MDFKITKESKKSIRSVSLPNSLIASLEEIAKNENIPFSRLVAQCCKYALDNINFTELK